MESNRLEQNIMEQNGIERGKIECNVMKLNRTEIVLRKFYPCTNWFRISGIKHTQV